ncbi:TetR family transcriptional regulator [Dictyobacter kobayashii]|uniref:TetR family transcriptional regulator n=2 Tax=Dictyobacter kobayashii TaxID=2014872 RepID=A0A402AR50_9CHLR|nr:TetR family transcriptional regulator [Dictyobacter kobayashii]
MVRTVNEQEYAFRRNAILDAVQQLIYSKGYEQMTIQDIVEALKISKGAFYHYFDSKQDVLEALLERMLQEAEQLFIPIVQDPSLTAIVKLQHFFDALNKYKTAQKTLLIELLRVWYADDNIIVRRKSHAVGVKRLTPLFAAVIRQGVQEGVLTTPYPEQISEVVLSIAAELGETLGQMLLAFESEGGDMVRVEHTIAAYTDALERILGASAGSLSLTNADTLREWFVSPQVQAEKHFIK